MTICAQKIWKLVNDVFHLGHAISHDNVLLGVDLDLSVNYVGFFYNKMLHIKQRMHDIIFWE